jgi:ABC-type glutathione transport system ATPase component
VSGDAVLRVRDLTVTYRRRGLAGRSLKAVDGVTFDIRAGETLGLVGESGSGKSTTARAVLRLLRPDAGTIEFLGCDITTLGQRELRPLRRDLQLISQNPYASLNPRRRVGDIVAEPLVVNRAMPKAAIRPHVTELLEMVGLDASHAQSYPHQFSGGQRQRIAIARAIALKPALIVCDEIVSGQDISIQARLVNLLKTLQEESGIALLFISHDLRVVRNIAHEIVVLRDGRVVEAQPNDALFEHPRDDYTRELLSSVALPRIRESPDPDRQMEA